MDTNPAAPVTPDRAHRLYRLIVLLGQGAQSRQTILRKLRLGVRGFYRDLGLIRSVGVRIKLSEGKYHLQDAVEGSLARLPFPDPGLTLGEAEELSTGRRPAHRKIAELLDLVRS